MFGLGMPEILIILAIALIVIGPKKLPDLAKTMGRAMGEFKRSAQDFKDSIDIETTVKDLDEPASDLKSVLKEDSQEEDSQKEDGKEQETDVELDIELDIETDIKSGDDSTTISSNDQDAIADDETSGHSPKETEPAIPKEQKNKNE